MKTHVKIVILITTSFLLNSCSYFSNDDKEKRKLADVKWKQKTELEANKDYHYTLKTVSYKSNISQDTVALVLQEYYKRFKGLTFNHNTNRLEVISEAAVYGFGAEEIHKLDFITNVIEIQFIKEKSAYLILNEIDNLFDIKNMRDDIKYLDDNVSEIQSHFEK